MKLRCGCCTKYFVVLVASVYCVIRSSGAENDKDRTPQQARGRVASVQEMIEARTDVWGDAAMRQPNGASYEFFKDLMPPLRWVNAEFHHYPIVLSAPRAKQKVRLVSNGSSINARGNRPRVWVDEATPINFFVGDSAEGFGSDMGRLETPSYADGYLPIVTIQYKSGGATYRQECFAPVDDFSVAHGAALVRFSLEKGSATSGRVEARIDTTSELREQNGRVFERTPTKGSSDKSSRDASAPKEQVLFDFSPNWKWDAQRKVMIVELRDSKTADIRVLSKPAVIGTEQAEQPYEAQRRKCADRWNEILSRGTNVVTPEPLVNDAWRSLVIGSLMLVVDDLPHYSAQNQYGPTPGSPRHLYEAECGDTLRSFLIFGQLELGPPMLKPMLEFPRKDTRFHVAGQKLQLLSFFYWITRDAETVRKYEPIWRQAEELILQSREPESGLLPRDNYAGDIHTQVHSTNSNSNCWRGLRDLAAVLDDMGKHEEADKLREQAADFRKAILKAAEQSVVRTTKPPYVPIALMENEKAPDPLTSTELGSYYDLICPYMICSEIFGQGSKQEDWMLGYLQNHGGICMGMMRTERHGGPNNGSKGIVPLYALRYNLALLRRDEREKVLVAFYGQLAQGMTRGTFIGGEGNRFLFHANPNGRELVLPPNSTSNATWLAMLRYMLIQDWDLDEDGKPETLRLMYGVPRAWLADGQKIHVENAPTMFGAVSLDCESQLKKGYVDIRVKPPGRMAKKMLLRAALPDSWQTSSAEIDGESANVGEGNIVDLTGRTTALTVRFKVRAKDKSP